MAGCFLYLSSSFTDWFLYKTHLYLCKQLYEGQDLPEPIENPLEAFCHGNIGRWIVFMVWLEHAQTHSIVFKKYVDVTLFLLL